MHTSFNWKDFLLAFKRRQVSLPPTKILLLKLRVEASNITVDFFPMSAKISALQHIPTINEVSTSTRKGTGTSTSYINLSTSSLHPKTSLLGPALIYRPFPRSGWKGVRPSLIIISWNKGSKNPMIKNSWQSSLALLHLDRNQGLLYLSVPNSSRHHQASKTLPKNVPRRHLAMIPEDPRTSRSKSSETVAPTIDCHF